MVAEEAMFFCLWTGATMPRIHESVGMTRTALNQCARTSLHLPPRVGALSPPHRVSVPTARVAFNSDEQKAGWVQGDKSESTAWGAKVKALLDPAAMATAQQSYLVVNS